MTLLGEAHNKRMLINFDAVLEAEKDREIEILTNEITRTCNVCAGRVKRLTKMAGGR